MWIPSTRATQLATCPWSCRSPPQTHTQPVDAEVQPTHAIGQRPSAAPDGEALLGGVAADPARRDEPTHEVSLFARRGRKDSLMLAGPRCFDTAQVGARAPAHLGDPVAPEKGGRRTESRLESLGEIDERSAQRGPRLPPSSTASNWRGRWGRRSRPRSRSRVRPARISTQRCRRWDATSCKRR